MRCVRCSNRKPAGLACDVATACWSVAKGGLHHLDRNRGPLTEWRMTPVSWGLSDECHATYVPIRDTPNVV